MPTEERQHTRGRKPSVDFIMSGIVKAQEKDAVYVILNEAKKQLSKTDMEKLAQYTTYIQGNVTLGLLVDESAV